MNQADLHARALARFPDLQAMASENGQPFLLVPRERIVEATRWLRDDRELAFAALMDLTAFDLKGYVPKSTDDAIAVVYLLCSPRHKHKVALQVLAPRADAVVPSVSAVWPAAIYFEREVFDLFGVTFTGHPSLQRILCPEDWQGHPLRKDYAYPVDYDGVPHLRDGQHFEGGPARPGTAAAATPAAPGGQP